MRAPRHGSAARRRCGVLPFGLRRWAVAALLGGSPRSGAGRGRCGRRYRWGSCAPDEEHDDDGERHRADREPPMTNGSTVQPGAGGSEAGPAAGVADAPLGDGDEVR